MSVMLEKTVPRQDSSLAQVFKTVPRQDSSLAEVFESVPRKDSSLAEVFESVPDTSFRDSFPTDFGTVTRQTIRQLRKILYFTVRQMTITCDTCKKFDDGFCR